MIWFIPARSVIVPAMETRGVVPLTGAVAAQGKRAQMSSDRFRSLWPRLDDLVHPGTERYRAGDGNPRRCSVDRSRRSTGEKGANVIGSFSFIVATAG